ncbi:MAG: sialidase family protein [Gemmataceae bacterium]
MTTDTARDPKWTWYGTGPGVQLKSGRLVIP